MDEQIKRRVNNILEDLIDDIDVTTDIERLIRQISGEKLDEVAVGNEYDTYDGLLTNIFEIRNTFFENFANNITYADNPLNRYANEIRYDWYTRLEQNVEEYNLSRPDLRQVVQRDIQELDNNLLVEDIPIPTFTEDEVRFFTNLLDSVTSIQYSEKISFVDFIEDVTTSDATTLKTRKKTYEYWEDVDNQFINLVNELNNTIELIEKLKIKDEEGLIVGYKEMVVPSYILKMEQVVLKKGILPNHPIVVDILEAKYLGEKIDDILDREDVAEYDGDKIRGWTQGIGTPDKEYKTALEEAREDLDELTEGSFILKDKVRLDPLLSIILQLEEFPIILNEEQIKQNAQKVIDKQLEDIPEENIEFNIDNLEEIREHMEKNLKLYEPILQDTYKFAIMDGPEISLEQVKFPDESPPIFEIQVAEYENGEFVIKEEVFSDYSELVTFINDKSNKFFSFLTDEIFKPESWAKTLSDEKAYRVPHPTRITDTRGSRTGRVTGEGYAVPAYKRIDAKDISENLAKLSDAIESFYYIPLDKKKVSFKDQPNFVKTEQYMAVERNISSHEITRVAREIASGRSKPQFDEDIFININSFVKRLNQENFERYKSSLKDESEDFIAAVTHLFKPLRKREQKQIQRNLATKLGSILYGLWEDSKTDSDAEPPKFMYRKLDYWNRLALSMKDKADENLSLVNLAKYFQRPEIKEYLKSDVITGEPKIRGSAGEEIVEVKTTKDKKDMEYLIYGPNGIMENLIRAETELKPLAKAILDSVDLIRKANNLPIFYGQLDINSYHDNSYTISHIETLYNIDIYATDIDTIVKSEDTINELKNKLGLPKYVIYHVKGLYR